MSNTIDLIDKKSPIPAYHQIVSEILNRINNNEWKIGQRLPSETAFSDEYNVSRVTVRQALSQLERRRIIVRHQGKGAFLTNFPNPFVEDLNLPSIRNARDPKSRNLSTILEFNLTTVVSKYVSQAFGPEGPTFPLVYLSRIFSKQGYPLGLNRCWFPSHLVPDIVQKGLINNSVSETLAVNYGFDIIRVENVIEATTANTEESSLLSIAYGTSLLRIQSLHFAKDDVLIQFSDTLWVGELTRFRFSAH